MSDIWIPGKGVLPQDVRTAMKAVEAYDARLELGYDERAGQWVVLWSDGPEGAPFPVMGLGKELPGYEQIQKILYMGDTARRGNKVVQDVIRRNEAKLAAARAAGHERSREIAEELEHNFRRVGKLSKPSIFVP